MPRDSETPVQNEVCWFVDLHLDTVKKTGPHSYKKGHCCYSVEGKPRPMLVIGLHPNHDRGHKWFNVLPITSQGRDERGKVLPDHIPIGNCLDEHRESFIRTKIQRLPDNMISRLNGSPIKRPFEPLAFANVLRLVEHSLRSN